MNTLDKWIGKGYEHFGLYGPENISIKQMAEETDLSRTSFNYYFKNKDEFINELLLFHIDINTKFCATAKQHCKSYLPDIHEIVLMYPLGFRFHKQLFNFRKISKFNDTFINVNNISAREFVVQLFIDYYKLPMDFEDACELHEVLLSSWYSRLDFNDENTLSLEYLVNSTEEIMAPLLKLVNPSK